jgi:hypothetical protein
MADHLTQLWVRVSNALYREEGQAVTEYALVLVVIVAGIATLLLANGGVANTIVTKITTALGKF